MLPLISYYKEPCTIEFNGGSDGGEGDDHDIDPGDEL